MFKLFSNECTAKVYTKQKYCTYRIYGIKQHVFPE